MTHKNISKEIDELLLSGRKIEAIRQLREEHGLDLKDAKNTIDTCLEAYPQRFPNRASRSKQPVGLLVVFGLLCLLSVLYLTGTFQR